MNEMLGFGSTSFALIFLCRGMIGRGFGGNYALCFLFWLKQRQMDDEGDIGWTAKATEPSQERIVQKQETIK